MTINNEHLPILAAITFNGSEAAHFLQGQLTINSEELPAEQWRRAAYCSRQGRMIACGILARLPDDEAQQRFVFIVRSDIAAATAAMLKRFVLRAKVKIDVPALSVAARGGGIVSLPPGGGALTITDGVAMADEGGGRGILFSTAEMPPQQWQAASGGSEMSGEWEKTEIQRAVPWVSAAVQELFIPQFVNFDVLGGVDFEKGCFVGQEVIARLHHLGEVKRRGMIIRGSGEAAAGAVLKTAEDKPAGEVVNSVREGDGFIALAAVVKNAAAQQLFINAAAVTAQPPPYDITEQEKFKRR